jgi:putrescine transport system ATP-binding protein
MNGRVRAPGTGSNPAAERRIVALLELAGISKRFGPVTAVSDVSFAVEPGEFFALLGPSGCGKTTLLRLIAGFETPDAGRILIDGVEMNAVPPYRRPVNMMFQSYALFPHLDVAANIAFGLRQEGMRRRRRDARVAEMLALVQMADYAHRRPQELSGGQKQRVALARALAKMPKLLLLDEPLAALDRKLREETRLELTGIQERIGTTFLVVTHDQEEALGMASRIAVMNRGDIVQIGTPATIYEQPNCRFVAGFVGAVNLFEDAVVVHSPVTGLAIDGAGDPLPLPESLEMPEEGRIAFAVRPEKLRVSASPPAGVALRATIVSIGYQGGQSTIHLKTNAGMGLRADLASSVALGLERGATVWVDWAPQDIIVLHQ